MSLRTTDDGPRRSCSMRTESFLSNDGALPKTRGESSLPRDVDPLLAARTEPNNFGSQENGYRDHGTQNGDRPRDQYRTLYHPDG